jgi:hypothetical protein
MNRQAHPMHSSLTRRRFLVYEGVTAGGMILGALSRGRRVLAEAGGSVAGSTMPGPGQGSGTSRVAFPLKISENRRYLVDSQGKPFFLLGDTPWFLQKVKLQDVRLILDDRVHKGFNTLFLEILDDSAMPSRDAYGSVAFEPETDITRPVETYWRYADTVMEEVTKRGFFVIMSELWYGAGRGLWMHHVTPAGARTYGRFLGRRYARFKNLMWMHCGDCNPDARLAECADELARAIQQEAPHHLHTAHLSHESSSADFFNESLWLDVNMAYTYGAAYLQVSKEYQRSDPVRPVILGETGYEDEPNAIELLPDAKQGDLWNPYRIRRNAWWAILSGACGYCAGTRLWRFETNWRDVLRVESSRQAPLIRKLLEPRPWWRLVPDMTHELVTGGYGQWKQADYVTAALAGDGELAVAYLPRGGTIQVAMNRFAGQVAATWFDPTNGEHGPVERSPFANEGNCSFTTPGANTAGDKDWVLVLEVAKRQGPTALQR